MNCPMLPADVAMPKAQLRFSGGTNRPKAAITMEKLVTAMPVPTSNPPVIKISPGVCEKGIRNSPAA